MMAGTPAAAGSSGAAFQAASSAVRPPPAIAFASDDHEDYQVRRILVDSCFCAVILASFFFYCSCFSVLRDTCWFSGEAAFSLLKELVIL